MVENSLVDRRGPIIKTLRTPKKKMTPEAIFWYNIFLVDNMLLDGRNFSSGWNSINFPIPS